MIRLIHNQTVSGPILVDDVDDGLPNKEVHRLGSLGDPKGYARDGYANKPKQACYVPYSHTAANGSVTAGYVTLQQTNRVTQSWKKGKIGKFSSTPAVSTLAGASTFPLVTVVTGISASQLVAPAVQDASTGSNVQVVGTTFTSISPDVTTVTFAQGTGGTAPSPASLTSTQITAAGGSLTSTTITIPNSAFTTAPVAGNTVQVMANAQNSNLFTIAGAPAISAAAHGPPVAITGTNLASTSPDTDTVTFAQGTGGTAPSPLTLSQAAIIAAGGSITATSISIPGSAFTTAPVANNTVQVTANGQNSTTFTLT